MIIEVGIIKKCNIYQIGKKRYSWVVIKEYKYTDNNICITVPVGFLCDGATLSPDINSSSWIIHDYLYASHKFDDDKQNNKQECTRKQADKIMYNILQYENRYLLSKIFLITAKLNIFNLFQKAWEISGSEGVQIKNY